MIQKIFATQQMAEELLKEAIAIWRQGNQSDNWEGIEKDPVVSLLMTALAYQEYASNRDEEWLKNEILQDFAKMLIPYDLCHALPASVLLQAVTESNVTELPLNEYSTFTLGGKYSFIPLLKTKVFNVTVKSVVRMDARRWKVSLAFKEPVKNLAGLSFTINNPAFKDLNVTISGRTLPLTKPWDYAELPLNDCFSADAMLYNESLIYDGASTWFDMFAQHNKRMFVVNKYQTNNQLLNQSMSTIDMVFEFIGIKDDFSFDKSELLLNSILLVNVNLRSTTLSSSHPITRITGAGLEGNSNEQLLHLIRPSVEQIFQGEQVLVRRSAVERFNSHSLFKLLHSLLDKYSSDYYAFQEIDQLKNKADADLLYQLLKSMTNQIENIPQSSLSGVYLMLKKDKTTTGQERSINIKYLTSSGSAVNDILDMSNSFSTPPGLMPSSTHVISEPIPGQDEVKEDHVQSSISRYYLITNNRLVTQADIKVFCYNELLKRYNIASDLIEKIVVKNQVQAERGHSGFETSVDIVLKNDLFVKRSFSNKISHAEIILQKMIEVRSATVYPVHVTIGIS